MWPYSSMISILTKGEIKRQIHREGEHRVNMRTVIHNMEQILRHSPQQDSILLTLDLILLASKTETINFCV